MAFTAEDLGLTSEEFQDRVIQSVADQILTTSSVDDEGYSHSLRSSFAARMEAVVQDIVKKRAEEAINGRLEAVIDDILSSGFQPVDCYGDPKGEKTTLRDMIKARAEAFLSEKVDKNGKSAGQWDNPVGTRLDVAMQKHVDGVCTEAVKRELTKAVEEAKAKLGGMVAKMITEKILK